MMTGALLPELYGLRADGVMRNAAGKSSILLPFQDTRR